MNKEQKQFLLSSLFSGIMIGIGCTVYLSCVNKLVGALLFCAGLFFILTNGGTLFTGICGLKTPVKKLAWVFVLNGLGTVIPAIVSWSNVVDGATKLGATAAAVMLGKLGMNPVSWLLNGLMCGVLDVSGGHRLQEGEGQPARDCGGAVRDCGLHRLRL